MMAAVFSAKAEVSFGYDAGFDLVTSYLWRGQYNGGLSFQPDVEFGYDGEHTSLRVGAWANLGASDWMFHKQGWDAGQGQEEPAGYTKFMPELDIVGKFTTYGLSVGFNHYYYFGGSNFFSWKSVEALDADDTNTSTTEVWAGYNVGDVTPVGLYFNWYSMVAGNDCYYVTDANTGDEVARRAWSSYFEIGYDYTFENAGVTLGAVVGMSPWESPIYGNSKFAVNNISLKINKEWEFDHVTLDLFAQGSLNTDGLNKDNVFIKASGDEKLCNQKLNGTIGLGIWF